jgi:hypothetical protein
MRYSLAIQRRRALRIYRVTYGRHNRRWARATQGGVSTDAAGPIVTSATAVRLTLTGGADNTPQQARCGSRFTTFYFQQQPVNSEVLCQPRHKLFRIDNGNGATIGGETAARATLIWFRDLPAKQKIIDRLLCGLRLDGNRSRPCSPGSDDCQSCHGAGVFQQSADKIYPRGHPRSGRAECGEFSRRGGWCDGRHGFTLRSSAMYTYLTFLTLSATARPSVCTGRPPDSATCLRPHNLLFESTAETLRR